MKVSRFFVFDSFIFGLQQTFGYIRLIIFTFLVILAVGLGTLLIASAINFPLLVKLFALPHHAPMREKLAIAFSYWPILLVDILLLLTFITWYLLGTARIALDVCYTERSSARRMFAVLPLLPRALCANILFILGAFVGLAFFIIPGIIWFIRFGWIIFFIVDKDMGVIESFKRSFELTRGYSWYLLAFFFEVSILGSMGAWGNLFTWPITNFSGAYIFRILVEAQQKEERSITSA